ncbi:alkanesulfonate monooxygenase SsuD/methylene tetrahydromethanopterin reductase-like flavin-dependent oxidoreductase (luciferase family) [Microbacterium ulmi]|uniref:LLM class flavin-dependent oxidoreductase n=2 Tax=Microbacterium ulmi TaxID=179095 RepID=A0A7Y2M1T2_9MICO|nr:LLM class flavin-dependent oxidoreductase [Microbacterium ulmi]NII68297.1 alkanesulfonate monooxygenase SsuD/methylene tetrahydromethanopterin reductase-like flavin-dependent oxidoreductase (luciferase family) [Microbacterium ulmi]NNH04859.1 LLM class flavin-dependent oxidoreductase [Microbacterium ulmi]
MAQASVSLGVAGTLGAEAISRIAAATEASGFHALWVNDTPGGDALAGLAAAAEATDSLVLASGVLPLDRRSPVEIARTVRQLRLPVGRLVLGVGSGGARAGALALVRDGVAALRETGAGIMVGALGPRMRRLAAEASGGPLLSWLTPEAASAQASAARAVSSGAHVALYVRTAFDPAARQRLDLECARYARVPAYRANLERLGIAASDTVIAPASPAALLDRHRAAVDEVVLRAIPVGDGIGDYLRFVEQAADRVAA